MAVPFTIRAAGPTDASFLAEMIAVAAFWRPDGPMGGVSEVLAAPELAHYVVGSARAEGISAISLSVEPNNPARRLYERFGFEQVGSQGGSITMLRST